MKRSRTSILSLPDELLVMICSYFSQVCDRRNAALTCSRFRNIIKHSCIEIPLRIKRTPGECLLPLTTVSRKCTWIGSAIVSWTDANRSHLPASVIASDTRDLLSAIALSSPRLETLQLVGLDHLDKTTWMGLAQRCRLLTNLVIFYAYPPTEYPPFHIFRALRSLSLRLNKDVRQIPSFSSCSCLSSLEFWEVNDLHLSSLVSSPPLPTVQSLTLRDSAVTSSLSSLTSFPNLSSLSFYSCARLDVVDMQALGRSVQQLTHLTFNDCLFLSSSGVAAVLQSNPRLTSFFLNTNSHLLFSPAHFKSILSSSRQLSTLSVSGFRVLQPSLLADCNDLQSLFVDGGTGSLESLASVLVRMEETSEDGSKDKKEGKLGVMDDFSKEKKGESSKVVEKALVWGRRGHLLRVAAAAAEADEVSAQKQVADFRSALAELVLQIGNSFSSATRAIEQGGAEGAIIEMRNAVTHLREGNSLRRLLRESYVEVADALQRELNLMRLVRLAGDSASFLPRNTGDDRAGRRESGVADEAAAESTALTTDSPSSNLVQNATPLGNMPEIACSLRAVEERSREGMGEKVAVKITGPLLQSLSIVSFQFTPTAEPSWLQQLFLADLASSTPQASSSFDPSPPSSSSSKTSDPVLSVLCGAAFEKVQRLSLRSCSGLGEDHLITLLQACSALLHLTVDKTNDFSDRVIADIRLPRLSSLNMLGCEDVSPAGVDGLLASFPRLLRLKVERAKVTERTGRALGRAGVILRSGTDES